MKADARVALVADDDEFFRMALRVVLTQSLGFAEVLEAPSLDEAIDQLANSKRVDLALFDLAMPGMKSPASLRAVRECNPDLRVAVVSGSQQRSDILLALASGVHGYIPKAIGAGEIGRAIKSVLNGTIYVPPCLAEIGEADEEGVGSPISSAPEEASTNLLTPRQRDVLELLVQGKSNKEIARDLALGEGTVKVHMSALFRSLGTNSRSAAAVRGAKILQLS